MRRTVGKGRKARRRLGDSLQGRVGCRLTHRNSTHTVSSVELAICGTLVTFQVGCTGRFWSELLCSDGFWHLDRVDCESRAGKSG